jgi:hypothetical protein
MDKTEQHFDCQNVPGLNNGYCWAAGLAAGA